MTEEHKAKLVEEYLNALKRGEAFDIPSEIENDPELLEMIQFSKLLHVSANPVIMPKRLEQMTQPDKVKKRWRTLVLPLPVIAAAFIAIVLITSKPQEPDAQLTHTTNTLDTELAVLNDLDTELAQSISDMDATLAELDELLSDESYNNIDLALSEAEL